LAAARSQTAEIESEGLTPKLVGITEESMQKRPSEPNTSQASSTTPKATSSAIRTPEERDRVYADRGLYPDCIAPGGKLRGRRVGRVRLGIKRDQALSRLGPPADYAHRTDRWCLIGKGELRVLYGRQGKAKAILTSGRGQSAHGVARGDRARRAHRRLDLKPAGQAAGARVFKVRESARRGLRIGIADRRVRWLLITKRRAQLSAKLPVLVSGVS
jgi:hypothetical protein